MRNILKVSEIEWSPHPTGLGGERGIIEFDNGYSASVLRGGPFYTDGGKYEIAIMRNGRIDYQTGLTDDVFGYLSESEADDTLLAISQLTTPDKEGE